MPLPAGVTLDREVHPPESWPPRPPHYLTAPPPGTGKGHLARVARDGTRWCAYRDHTVDPDSKIQRCDECAAFRDRFRKHPASDQFLTLPAVVVEALLDYIDQHLTATARLETLLDMHQDPTRADLENLHKSATYLAGIGQILIEYRQSQLSDEAKYEPERET